ncbi:hypothetical protein ACJMK2_037104 [Sinanodonta woodiana]|uniref:DDHD domain-containing protein n=1 Tax=Sinanodonta woodiana TaxID=1069815 RepID=A0ABD3WJA1_SINWO
MMGEFGTPGDGMFRTFSRPESPVSRSSPLGDRIYPSVDSLGGSDSFEEIDSDTASITGESRSTPPVTRKQLFPRKEFVSYLQPEEIRWFFKNEGDKKWTPFIGYDSLRIECRYRVKDSVSPSEPEKEDIDVILVKGGLYEVDVANRKCKPVYWTEDEAVIMRGTWFYEGTWQPVEDGYATQIETEHLGRFLGCRLDEQPLQTKGPKPVLHRIKFSDIYVDWNSTSEIYLFSDSTSSRIMRAVSSKLGVQKTGTRLYRGYSYEAVMDDKPAEISHLVFVIHGIRQKMDSSSIVKSCKDLRECANYLKAKHFPDLHDSNQRAEFLPVEWRSSLSLDGDIVETITPHKLKGVRTILNSSAMDILYYTSPLYRSEITTGLLMELNRLYQMFCTRNPYFLPNEGKVSIVAHSLGCVITYDILTGWNPLQLYDQFVLSLIDEEREQAGGSSELIKELDKAKKRVNELESLLMAIHTKQHHSSSRLDFKVENMFCLGSPLAVFLALRGIRPQGKGTADHIIPKATCKRLFNIYHPADPVAYRLEPLVLKHYCTVMPLTIHHHDASQKLSYTKVTAKAYAAFTGSKELVCEKSDQSDKESVDSSEQQANGSQTHRKKISLKSVGGLFSSFTRSMDGEDKLSAELKMLKKMERRAKDVEKFSPSPKSDLNDIDHTDLEYRLDYQLKETGIHSGYIAMLTSHTAYWNNKDVAYFILTHLHPETLN